MDKRFSIYKKIHEQEHNKRKRLSILLYISLLFVVAVVVSMVLIFCMTREFRFKYAAKRSGEIAEDACMTAKMVIEFEDPELTLFEDEGMRKVIHERFRNICQYSNLRYLYLYTIDENQVRHHLVVAAASDQDDTRVNNELGYGTTSDTPLHEAEMKALQGERKTGYDIVNNEYGEVCTWYLPVFDSNDHVAAIVGADFSMGYISNLERTTVIRSSLIMMVIFAVSFVLAILLIRGMVLKPIREISKKMKGYMKDRNCDIPKRKLILTGTYLEDWVEDEISDIAESFSSMGKDINNYLSQIEDLTRVQLHNQIQMDVARNIQYGIVPPKFKGENGRIFCKGFMHAARAVGGDFYDSFYIGDDKYCGMIGDVSDKGISAALFMAVTRTMLRDYLSLGISPADAINRANNELFSRNPENMFVTVFIFILDLKTGEAVFANAGHDAPLMITKDEAHFLEMDPGMVIGLMEEIDIKNSSFKLEPSQSVLIFTDGVTDSVNTAGECYGTERIKQLFDCKKEEGYYDLIIETTMDSVNEYSKDCDQFDDMTMLAITYKG